MSAVSAVAVVRPSKLRSTPGELARRARPLTRRLLAFAALATLASARFAALVTHPPALRVLALVALATGAGGALAASATLRPRALALPVRLALLAAGAVLSLRAAGVAPADAWPWGWARLAHEVERGLNAYNGIWPYSGSSSAARLTLLLTLPPTLLAAAALAFWPGGRAHRRRAAALALLLALYAAAVANRPQVGWQIQGVLLLAVLALWLAAWLEQPLDRPRAAVWVLAAALLALSGAALLRPTSPLLDYRSWNPFAQPFPATAFNWNETYGLHPWPSTDEGMVRASTRAPHLWRATTLDRFDGFAFVRSERTPSSEDQPAELARHPGWITHVSFVVQGFSSALLLSSGSILESSIRSRTGARLAAVASDGTESVSGADPLSGDSYTVTAYTPHPSAAELRRAPRELPVSYLPYTELELPGSAARATSVSAASPSGRARLEGSPYRSVDALARRLAAGAAGRYALVERVQRFLRHGFRYSQITPPSTFPLITFLLRDRVGYCQQFSGAMTLLLRMDGVPARVAAGFLPGTRRQAGAPYEVTAREAHAWVEVFFAGIGWVPFDPTPPTSGGGLDPILGEQASAGEESLRHRSLPQTTALAGAAARPRAGRRSSGSLAIPLALALAAALAAALLGGSLRARSHRAGAARAGDGEEAVRELARALPRLGLPIPPGITLRELEDVLDRSYGPAAARYARLLSERRYAPEADLRRPTARDRRRLRSALWAGRGARRRLRVLLALPPGAARGRQRLRSARAPL